MITRATDFSSRHLRKQSEIDTLNPVNLTALKKRNGERLEARKAMGWKGL